MPQTRTIPAHMIVSIKVRGNLAYETAARINKTREHSPDRYVFEDVFAERIRAFLKAVSAGALAEIQRSKGAIK